MIAELSGGCLCGAVRYRAAPGFRLKPYACHCTDCQTRTGGAVGLQLSVMEADLTIEGDLVEGRHVQPSGAVAGIFACSKCLTRIYTSNDQRFGIVNLRAGTLDDSEDLVPAAHFWTRSKQPWMTIPDDVPSLPTQPETPEQWLTLLKPDG